MPFVGRGVVVSVVFNICDAVDNYLVTFITVICADNVIDVVVDLKACCENYACNCNGDIYCNAPLLPPALTPLMNKIMGGTISAANRGDRKNVNIINRSSRVEGIRDSSYQPVFRSAHRHTMT